MSKRQIRIAIPFALYQKLDQYIKQTGLDQSQVVTEALRAYLPSNNLTSALPPRVPKKVDKLNRAISLLGNCVTVQLRDKTQKELEQLIGTYPTKQQAKIWRKRLQEVARQKTQDKKAANRGKQRANQEQQYNPFGLYLFDSDDF